MDDGQLLEVFLAEVGTVGLGEIEQAADHLYDAVEVSRTHLAFHHLIQSAEIERKLLRHLFGRVHLFGRGGEHILHAQRCQQLAVALYVAGVFGKVLFVVELGGVDKHAHHTHIILFHGAAHQRRVSFMQGTHRGNQTDRLVVFFAFAHCLLQG